MKIPKKISPDRIKDSIVEFRYISKIPFEVAVGIFYNSLDETYSYTNRPIGRQQPQGLPEGLELQIGNRPLFYNDKIKIELQPNSIIFNCLSEYISWDLYKIEIDKALSQLNSTSVIEKFNRVGIRYISEYPNTDLKDCVKFSFTFGMPEIISKTYRFNCEFKQDNLRIILNLNSNLPVINSFNSANNLSITPVSNIDIDVIMENIEELTYSSLMQRIDAAHLKQKEIFFSLLKEDFLSTLNPIY